MNKFLKEFKMGNFHQCTGEEELSKLLDKEKQRLHWFDCTAEGLHVGSLNTNNV